MNDIKFACPRCGQTLACEETGQGTRVRCPVCEQEMIVPANTATGPPPLARLLSSGRPGVTPPKLPSPPVSRDSLGESWVAFLGGLVLLILFAGSCRPFGVHRLGSLFHNPISLLLSLAVLTLLYWAGYRIASRQTNSPVARVFIGMAFVLVIQAVIGAVLLFVLFAGCVLMTGGR